MFVTHKLWQENVFNCLRVICVFIWICSWLTSCDKRMYPIFSPAITSYGLAEYRLFHGALLQKSRISLRSLLIVAPLCQPGVTHESWHEYGYACILKSWQQNVFSPAIPSYHPRTCVWLTSRDIHMGMDMHVYTSRHRRMYPRFSPAMGWLRLVGLIKL